MDEAYIQSMAEGVGADQLAPLGIDAEDFLRTYFEGFDYTVGDVTVDGSRAAVSVTFNCKSMSAFSTAMQQVGTDLAADPSFAQLSEEEMYHKLGESIMEVLKNIDSVQAGPAEFVFTKEGNTWTPQEEESMANLTTAMMAT